MWWEGESVMGKIEVLNTPSGKILKELVKAGCKLGISSRGLGSTNDKNGVTEVQDDFQLICFDMVSEPSTPNAYLERSTGPTMVNLDPNINVYLNESKDNKIDKLLESILRD